MQDNVHPLPIWKAGSTAEEWLMELAHQARAHPGDFHRIFIVYHGRPSEGGDGTIRTSNREGGQYMEPFALLGLVEMGRKEVLRLNDQQLEDEAAGSPP